MGQQKVRGDSYTLMENYKMPITFNKKARHFEISDHPHHAGERKHYLLHPCQNPGDLGEELLHILAARIEVELPHPVSKYIKKK